MMFDPTLLRRLAEAATPGPWRVEEPETFASLGRDPRPYQGRPERAVLGPKTLPVIATVWNPVRNFIEQDTTNHNVNYIAAMHPATTLALLDRLARAEMLVAQCKKTLIAMKPHEGWVEDSDVARLYIKTMEALGNE